MGGVALDLNKTHHFINSLEKKENVLKSTGFNCCNGLDKCLLYHAVNSKRLKNGYLNGPEGSGNAMKSIGLSGCNGLGRK